MEKYTFILLLFALLYVDLTKSDNLPACRPEDFHYEYTECDSDGGRWRVSVPKPNTCVDGAPNPPVRGRGCDFTCEEGKFLNLASEEQECEPCPAGTYSLGGGVKYDQWDHVPNGFSETQESFVIPGFMREEEDDEEELVNCTVSSAWQAYGEYVGSIPSDCSSSLLYSANLVQPGYVSFLYQFNEKIRGIFQFQVQNEQCQDISSQRSHRYPQQTEDGEWRAIKMPLTTGINILEWRTMAIDISAETWGQTSYRPNIQKPIKIKEIQITGVAYTSECSSCPGGYISSVGASDCEICPPGTYAHSGDSKCTPCDAHTQYSAEGASECIERPPCTENDYFSVNTPCENGQTRMQYSWIQPQICMQSHAASVQLPPPSDPKSCPPCSPGMEYKNGTCHFCPEGSYSDGRSKCTSCPASTAPKIGINIHWWHNLPENANITPSCLSADDRGCTGQFGWLAADDNIHTTQGHADDAYLVLGMDIDGFRGVKHVVNGKPAPVANISFVFELNCQGDCILFFMMQSGGDTMVVESWRGTTAHHSYSYSITTVEPVSFSWAFQKKPEPAVSASDSMFSRRRLEHTFDLTTDRAMIYSIDVTNTQVGGATECESCPQGASKNGCVPCPTGHYIDYNTTKCVACPDNTVVRGINPWGEDSCVACGEGLTPTDHIQCTTQCKYTTPQGKTYDFTSLAGIQTIQGNRLFTTSGTQYYHLFNVSLCAGSNDFPIVNCRDNITFDTRASGGDVNASLCRSTLIPPRSAVDEPTYSTQPLSLGDQLMNITNNGSSINIAHRIEEAGFDVEVSNLDVHFTYLSEMPTASCPQGRSTIITLHCDQTQLDQGRIMLPPRCPDGTCDGCNFHLLWLTQAACPICTKDDYDKVVGECRDGVQDIHYIPPKTCVSPDDKLVTETQPCTLLPFWVMICIYVAIGVGFLMMCLLIYCWKKNRKLEYKYMKLVGTSADQEDGELPAAETCALDEGEDEEFDTVKFQQQSKGKRLLNKLKGYKDGNPFESIKLSEKEALT